MLNCRKTRKKFQLLILASQRYIYAVANKAEAQNKVQDIKIMTNSPGIVKVKVKKLSNSVTMVKKDLFLHGMVAISTLMKNL